MEKIYTDYSSPIVELLYTDSFEVLCQSGSTEDYIDHQDPDWLVAQ